MRILIAHSAARSGQAWREAIAARMPDATVATWPDVLEGGADYAIGWQMPEAVFGRERSLKALFVAGAGVDHALTIAALDPAVPILRIEDAGMGRQIAEYCLCEVLGWCTNRNAYEEQQRMKIWRPLPSTPREEWPVGIFGLGCLGQKVAEVFASLGFPVSGYARQAKQIDGIRCYADADGSQEAFAAFLRATRVLIVLAPLTVATRDWFDERRLRQLPSGSYVINVARGEILVEDDLISLLDAGHLAGATLDVVRAEPLPADHVLWRHPKVRITPHIAAVTIIDTAADQVVAKIRDLEAGRPVSGVVDRRRGY